MQVFQSKAIALKLKSLVVEHHMNDFTKMGAPDTVKEYDETWICLFKEGNLLANSGDLEFVETCYFQNSRILFILLFSERKAKKSV